LTKTLAQKADKTLLTRIEELKATRAELGETNSLIVNLNERIKHLSIIQNSIVSQLEPVSNSISQFDHQIKKEMHMKLSNI